MRKQITTSLHEAPLDDRTRRDLERLGVNSIPLGWKLSTVGNACSIKNELRLPLSVDVRQTMSGDYPYYGPTGILDLINEYRVEGEFALIGEDGDHFLDVEAKPQTIRVSGRFNVNNHAHIISDTGNCSVDWFFYFFQHRDISHSLTRQGAGRYKLTKAALERLPLLLPSSVEQRRIAEILRAWDEAIEKLEAVRKAKEQRFSAVAQRLLAPARAIGRNIPRSNWGLITFGEVFEERQDRNVGLGPDDVVTVGKYAIRKQSEHFTRSVASKDQSNYWTISPGDFVYDPMSAYYGALGRYDGTQDGIVSPAYRVIRLTSDVDPDFMVHLLRSHTIRFQLESKSSQGNKEGKRRLLQRDEFSTIEFNLPPVEVQRDVSRILALFRQDVTATKREIDALSLQKRGLMQKLLTGEWRVKSDAKMEAVA